MAAADRAGVARVAMLVALAACGSPHALVDGGGGDAGGADGAGGMAHVVVHAHTWIGDGAPLVGASVEAASADGVIVGAATTTDADGSAAIDAPVGGMVVVTTAGVNDKTVIAGVKDGDVLELGKPLFASVGSAFVGFPTDGTATRYTMLDGCGGYSGGLPSYPIVLYPPCAGPHTIVVEADSDTQVTGYLVAPNITLVDGDDITLTGTWEPPMAATIGVINAPADLDANSIDVARDALANGFLVTDHAGRPVLTGGAGTVSLVAAASAGDRQVVQIDFRIGGKTVFVFAESALGDATVDLGAVPSITRTGPGTWTLGGAAAVGIFDVEQYRDEAGALGAIRFILPPDATHVVAPAGLTITGTTGYDSTIVGGNLPGGYDGYRQGASLIGGVNTFARDRISVLRYF